MTGPDPSPGTGRSRPSGADRMRDEMIADLDARFRRHEDTVTAQLGKLDTTVAASAGLLAETLPRVDALAERVAEMTGRIDQGAGRRSSGEETVTPVCWPVLTAAKAEQEWNLLADWVATVLGPWYQVRRGQVPDCWALHRGVVVRVSWLHRAYLAAHTGPTASTTLAAEWHARWLPAALEACTREAIDYYDERARSHVKPWSTCCRPGYHLDPREPSDRPRDQDRPALPHEQMALTYGHSSIDLRDDPIDHRFWGGFWRQAVAADLAWRREREAGQPTGAG